MEDVFNEMIYHLAIKYIKLRDNNNDLADKECIERFNACNNFNVRKLSLLPFLISIANGSKTELLKAFKYKFAPLNFGIANYYIYQKLIDNSTFGIVSIMNGNTTIQNNYVQSHSNHNILRSINVIHQSFPDFILKDSDDLYIASENLYIYNRYKDQIDLAIRSKNKDEFVKYVTAFNSDVLSTELPLEISTRQVSSK